MTVCQAPVPVRATVPAPGRDATAAVRRDTRMSTQYESPVREEHDATQRRHPR
ncbi:hypothetical protein EHYA_10445 [Embleya hyalina]|uniref:Uncharacterized protein n=1 Tax=Embleya hyalina TaxID=516124 RepID=A0A401Z5K1_9ACTN|nr:hypothetical protein EHYA_09919 [Embleya hyalina]GCE02663.1 hypothetical protein EHYA_10445 [Embleya hyalina]